MSKPSEVSNYFQQWYESNRDELNQRRRTRYQSDPTYRAKIRSWNQTTREKRKRELEKEAREVKRAVKMQPSSTWKTISVEVDGVEVRMFTVGALAKALGKSISTLRVWEQNGTIPETPYRSQKGDRLYTLEMVEAVRRTLSRSGRLDSAVLQRKKPPLYVERDVVFKGRDEPLRMQLYRIGTMAKALNRSPTTIVNMERGGALPRTPFLASSVQHRLYSLDMIEVAQKELSKRSGKLRTARDKKDFCVDVLEGWIRLGVMDARLADESETG